MNRCVLITGGSRGIGLELCRLFHDNGDRVFTTCRKMTPELNDLGVKVIEGIDVTSDSDCKRLNEAFNNETIDILINCAGLLHSESLNNLDFDQILRQFEVNSLAPLRVTHILLDKLASGSKVAIITSRMGSIDDNTSGGYYGYRMSKAAVNMAGKSLSEDLRSLNIAVGLLHPGFVKTRMTNFSGDSTPEESAAGLFKRIEELNMSNTGCFRHANGQDLPW